MKNVGIISVGSFVPAQVLTNFDLEKMVETSDEWITTRTGIKERRIAAQGERNSHLAINAAKAALKRADFDPAQLDLIIVATISPDSNFPSVACLVQKSLGAKSATAFDVSAACAGFLFALTTAKQYILSGMYKNALVIASEKITSLIDWSDRNTCVLFGDGAGACLLGKVKDGHGIIADYLHSQGQYSDLMTVVNEDRESLNVKNKMMAIPYVLMQGQELFKIAVNSMAEAVEIAVAKAGLKLSDIDCVVPHQANDRIISAVAKKLDLPKDKIFINIHRYGNMSAASIAVALDEAIEHKQIKKGNIIVLVAFGAGLVTAANVVRW